MTDFGGREGDTALSRKILIVEDDASTSAYLAKGLAEAGHAIEACADGRDGLFLASEGIFDLIIADRMLPGLDGLSMVSDSRGRHRDPRADPVRARRRRRPRRWPQGRRRRLPVQALLVR